MKEFTIPNNIKKDYRLVKSLDKLPELYSYIDKYDYHAFDVEATGLNTRKDKVIGFSICGEYGKAYYISILEWDKEQQKLVRNLPEEVAVGILNKLKTKDLLMWNALYDVSIVQFNLGVELINALVSDVMLQKHTLQEDGTFRLKEVAVELQDKLGYSVEEQANEEQVILKENVAANGGSTTKNNYEMYKADLSVMYPYACMDVDLTIRLGDYFYNKLDDEGLCDFFFDIEVMPLLKEVTYYMVTKPIKIDMKLLHETNDNIIKDLEMLERDVRETILATKEGKRWAKEYIETTYPVSNRGKFVQAVCEYYQLPLPRTKSGSYSVSKSNVDKLPDSTVKTFIQTGQGFVAKDIKKIRELLIEKNNDPILNIGSKKQLSEIVFDKMKIKALSKTDKGSPQFNDTLIDHLVKEYNFEWAKKLSNYNKLSKIKSSYIDRYLELNEDGYFYPSFFQHRTISGRYGSDMQQLPRPKGDSELPEIVLKYNNIIRKFFISGDDRRFIDNDYESLEPHVFAHVSGDEGLRDIFRKGHDFYSTIAITTEKLEGVSADKTANNYLGKVNKPLRQKAKAYCFTKDTLVDTINGPVPISKVKVGDYVNTRQGYKPVEKLFNRKADTILVHTNRGTLECTEDHPFLVDGEWKDASDLEKGDLLSYSDKVDVSDDVDYVKLPIYSNFYFKNGGSRSIGDLALTEDWAYFVGAVLGDGIISISKGNPKHGHGLKGYVGICGLESDGFLRHIESFLNSLGYKMRVTQDRGDFKSLNVTNSELAKITYDTLQLGDMEADLKSKNLKVPDYIMKSPKKVKMAFLAGLFDTDGYIKNNHGKMSINLCSKDHRLSTGVVRLLNGLGVKTSYRLDYNKTYKRHYYLVSISREGGKMLNALGMSNYMKCIRKKEALESYGDYNPVYKSRIKPPQVTLVEKSSKKEVYDIKVKDCHEFYANGVLVHNCLGIPYGMSAFALGKTLDISTKEAEALVDGYLNGFPNLKKWMKDSEYMAKTKGYVKSEAGRIRHLPKVKEIYSIHRDKLLDFKYRKKLESRIGKDRTLNMYRDYKNGINNAKNVQIQSLSASIVNLSAIEINRELRRRGIDGWVCLQIHDQLVVNVPKDRAEECRDLVQSIMENNYKLSLKLKAPAEIGVNLYEAH